MRRLFPIFLTVAMLSCPLANAAQITNVIDTLSTSQIVITNNATVTSTIASAGSIGGFRSMTLITAGGDPPEAPQNSSISISAISQRFALNTAADATTSFEVRWGGAGGTSGLGADFGAGQPLDLTTSVLSFSLRSADQANSFTWQFIDSLGNTASYTDTFPTHAATDPALPYNITLNTFSNASSVNWNSVNYVVFSGGGLEVDTTISAVSAPFQVVASTVPEPGTYALLATGIAIVAWAVRRRACRDR